MTISKYFWIKWNLNRKKLVYQTTKSFCDLLLQNDDLKNNLIKTDREIYFIENDSRGGLFSTLTIP